MMGHPYKFPKVARPQNGILAKQDLAMLEDPKTRHAAMKTLKGYIRLLDEESLPYFLDSLCQSKEHGPQRTLIISLYEDVARIHGKLLIPHIATIMTSITHTLEASGSDFQLHSSCAKAMKTIASSCIDSTTANQQAGQILQSLSECLLEPLVSTFQPVAGGAAFCLRLLAEVDAWQYLPEAIVNELLIRLTRVLNSNTTVNHLELAWTLAKTNKQMLDMYALAWLGSGIKVLQCMTNEWKHRLAAVQLINAILNSVQREKLFPGIDVVVEALERSRYDKIPKVRTAVSEALHTAKAIATECEKLYECGGGRKGSSDMLFVLAKKLKKQFRKASSSKKSRHTPRTYLTQGLSSKPSSSCVACIRKLDDRHHKTSNLEYSNQYNGHILHLRPIKKHPHLEESDGDTSEQAGLQTSKGYNSPPKCPTPTRTGSTAISVKCSIVDNDFKDLYSFDDVLCTGAVNVVVIDSETEAMPRQSLMSSNNTASSTDKEELGSVDSKIVDEVENLFWSCITNLNTLPEIKDVSNQDWRFLPLDVIQGPLNCILQLDFLEVDDGSEIEHDKENQVSPLESETEFDEEHSSSLSETTAMVKRYKKPPSETTEVGKNKIVKMDMDAYSETEHEKEHQGSPAESDKEHKSPPSETVDMVKSHAESPSWTTDMSKDKIVKMDEHIYNGSIWNMRHNPIADSITEDDIPVLSTSRTSTVYRDALIAEAQKAEIETAGKDSIPIHSRRMSNMYKDALNAGAQQTDLGAIKDSFNFESVDREASMAKAERINLRTTEDCPHLEYTPCTRIFNIHDDALMVETQKVGIGTTEDCSDLESTIISKNDFPSRKMPSRRMSSGYKNALILEDQKVNAGTSEDTANFEMPGTKDIFGSERIPFRRISNVCEDALMKRTQKIDVGTIEDGPISEIKNAFHSRRTPNVHEDACMAEIQNIDITNREDWKINNRNLKTMSDTVQIPVRSSTSSSSKFLVPDSVDWTDRCERQAAPSRWYMPLWGSIFPVNSRKLCKIAGELYSMVYSALEGFLRVSLFFVILVPIVAGLVKFLFQSCNEYELLLPT